VAWNLDFVDLYNNQSCHPRESGDPGKEAGMTNERIKKYGKL
jgi:hypothetical protein